MTIIRGHLAGRYCCLLVAKTPQGLELHKNALLPFCRSYLYLRRSQTQVMNDQDLVELVAGFIIILVSLTLGSESTKRKHV